MKLKFVYLIFLILFIAGCSLAGDVTPPPVLATAQAAPVQQDAAPARPAPQELGEVSIGLNPPETTPNILNGAAIYIESCEPCHGPSGLGDGSMSENLEVPVPPLGDFEFARTARPLDWYRVVTEGRMDQFMPPFRSLSDAQRWDVVSYVLSLSYPLDTRQRGADLFGDTCAECHGDIGQGNEIGPSINTSDQFADHSIDELLGIIQTGKGNMPALAEGLAEEDQRILAAYTQSLGAVVHEGVSVAANPSSSVESSEPEGLTGIIRGTVVNGTTGMDIPDTLDVTVIALEGNTPVFEQEVSIDREGNFSLEDLEIVAGRIFGVLVEYQRVVYFSVGGHLIEEAPILDLPLVIYESTPDTNAIMVERLHLIFDFSVEGFVEVSQLWLLSTEGDRTVAGSEGANALPIQLPDGFSNLRFGNAISPDQFTVTDEGLLIHEPIRPGEPLEVIFSFMLPYERSLDFTQPIGLPVQAVVLLTESDAPEIQGRDLQDLGERDMGGILLHNYAMDSLEAGGRLDLTLRGTHPITNLASPTSNLAIGLGVLGVVLVIVGVAIWRWQRRPSEAVEVEPEEKTAQMTRAQLLRAIASLDDAFEAGDIERKSYEQRRAVLKSQIVEQIQGDDD